MLSRVGNILEEHNAHLPNFELRFNKKVRGGTAGANVQPAPGKPCMACCTKLKRIASEAWIAMRAFPSTTGASKFE